LAVLALAPVITGFMVYVTPKGIPPVATSTSLQAAAFATMVVESAGRSVIAESQTWIVPLWIAGVVVFGLRFIWSAGYAHALRRTGVEADSAMQSTVAALCDWLEIRRKIRVIISSIAEVPSTVGWLRPVILLPPAALLGIAPQQLEALIAHELAHVRRYDYFVNILQMAVETLLFYHPAVWWMSSRIRYERELCCDDLVVRFCGDAVTYARALAQVEKLRPVAGIAMGSSHGPVFHRIPTVAGFESRRIRSIKACMRSRSVRGNAVPGTLHEYRPAQQNPTVVEPTREVDVALQQVQQTIEQLQAVTPSTPLLPPIPPIPPLPPVEVQQLCLLWHCYHLCHRRLPLLRFPPSQA
jgi:beta-lactamase regulating signal transducer with metallopeptidase domain